MPCIKHPISSDDFYFGRPDALQSYRLTRRRDQHVLSNCIYPSLSPQSIAMSDSSAIDSLRDLLSRVYGSARRMDEEKVRNNYIRR